MSIPWHFLCHRRATWLLWPRKSFKQKNAGIGRWKSAGIHWHCRGGGMGWPLGITQLNSWNVVVVLSCDKSILRRGHSWSKIHALHPVIYPLNIEKAIKTDHNPTGERRYGIASSKVTIINFISIYRGSFSLPVLMICTRTQRHIWHNPCL